jgi:pimeloyl-ACP methyl ester carboxylesterase
MLLRPMVEQERKKLIESGAQRAKILSSTKQEIDTLFFDRRLSTQEGETLFITSEGNAGFMEIGSFATVSKSSFSVLGYNHPGFGGSTGTPYQENDAAAVAAVIDYAKHELGFTESQIVVYAWSIGGFDATVAGSAYRELKGLYLDATFDDVMPLADNVMPKALAPITVKTIRSIWNLNNSHYLSKFPGPVTILRRNNDEIMQKNPRIVEDNRANQLLLDFLDVRYPSLMTNQSRSKLKEFLSIGRRDESISWMQSQVDISMAKSIIESWQHSKDASTTSLGDDMDDELRLTLLLYLVNKHFVTMDGPHGQPVPIQLLDIPWKMR